MPGSPADPFRFDAGHYHLHVHTISKLKNKSVLAAAAYRRAEIFRAEPVSVVHAAAYQRAQQLGNDGQVFDYRRKIGVAWTGIFAPTFTPPELRDPHALWNTVERIEHRKNARLAREMIIALPHQVSQDVHVAMLSAFITNQLVAKGMVADVAIHRPPVEHGGDPRNWHAHILLTDRPMTPTGFAATKDRTWNARDNLLQWRQAWADCHNATMEALGLPHRIDHRSLEAQRRDALQRGDTIAALELDRLPQIHVGKAAYGHHPNRTIYGERRDRNRDILIANKNRAFGHKDRLDAAIARADSAAYLEARRNAQVRATWEVPEPEIGELQKAYGRPASTSVLGKVRHTAIAQRAEDTALALSRAHDHPWRATGHRQDAPSILDILLPTVKKTGPGHPVFTVTAKDLAFAFYGLGLIGLTDLRRSLERIAMEERLLFADRIAKKPKLKPPKPLPRPPAPASATREAERLQRLRQAIIVPQAIYMKRLGQLRAYTTRHRSQSVGHRDGRRGRYIVSPPAG